MIPAGLFLEENSDQLNKPLGTSDDVWKRQVWQKLGEAYRSVACSYAWSTLRRTVTLSDSTYIVPSDCRVITDVRDDNKQPYNFMVYKNRNSKFNYNWYFANPISTVLAEGTTLNVSEYATALTSTAEFPATTCVGEFCRIGSNAGIYPIATWTSTSAMTLTDHFRGDTLSNAKFQVRPRGTQVLAFCDATGTALSPTGVEVTYIKFSLPLYTEEDTLDLPGFAPAVSVKMLQKLLALNGFNQAADRKQNEYLAALSEMKSSEVQEPIVQPTKMFHRRIPQDNDHTYLRGLSIMNSG